MNNYTELVAQLRERADRPWMTAAADAIESLQAEVERLRKYERILVRERNEAWEERNRLREELAAAQKDAERWRFARKNHLVGSHESDSLGDCHCYFKELTVLEIDAAMQEKRNPRKCKCDLRTRLVGDGCEVCNPQLATELVLDRMADDARAAGMAVDQEERDD